MRIGNKTHKMIANTINRMAEAPKTVRQPNESATRLAIGLANIMPSKKPLIMLPIVLPLIFSGVILAAIGKSI